MNEVSFSTYQVLAKVVRFDRFANSLEVKGKGDDMYVLNGEKSVRDGIILDGVGVSIVGMTNVDGKKGDEGVKTRNRDDEGVKILGRRWFDWEVWRKRGWLWMLGTEGEVCCSYNDTHSQIPAHNHFYNLLPLE